MAMVGLLTILAVVQTGSLFSADAWNNVTYTAGEVRNPKRKPAPVAGAGDLGGAGLYISRISFTCWRCRCTAIRMGRPSRRAAFNMLLKIVWPRRRCS